jgi:phytol kinase
VKRLLLFLSLWLAIGFSIGTATLLGPVRWIATVCRERGLSPGIEKGAVEFIIVLLIASTATAALIIARMALASRRPETRYGPPILAFAAAAGAVVLWMSPATLQGHTGGEVSAGKRFTFGPYPDEERLASLRLEGYTAVVSLLHPAVIPFEPELLRQEQEAAARAGIEVIHLPMLPWLSDNQAALDKVRELARSGTGRYYVHCYLGMDRVQMVRRVVEETAGDAAAEALEPAASIARVRLFERGAVTRLDGRVFVGPFPTDEELLRYAVGRGAVRLVSLLDERNPDDRPWLDKERALVAGYRLPWIGLPLSESDFDPAAVLAAARAVRDLPGMSYVHDFLAPDSGRAAVAEAFVQAYRSGRPPLPPSQFAQPLQDGPVTVVGPHVAIGPRPRGDEFAGVLARCGVRQVLRLAGNAAGGAGAGAGAGQAQGAAARADRADRAAAAAAGLRWEGIDAPGAADVVTRLEHGGPFFIYGAEPEGLRAAITARFGPALPAEISPEAESLFAAITPARSSPGPRPERAAHGPARNPATPSIAAAGMGSAPARPVESNDAPAHDGATPAGPEGAPVTGGSPAAAVAASRAPASGGGALGRFVAAAVPDREMVILLGPVLLMFTWVAAAFAGWMRVAKGWPVAYSRKGFHFAIFTMAGVVQILGGLPAVMLFGGLVSGVVLYAVLRGEGFPFYEALARPADAPRRTLFILVPLVTTALGGLLANLLFGAWAIVGYLVGGWGDAVGEPVGAAIGRHRYRVPSIGGVRATRSLEGSAAVLLAGALAAFACLLARGVDPVRAAGVGAACGIAGALVEAFSSHGTDNLTVQLAAAGVAFLFLA